MDSKEVEELQEETREKERIVLAMNAGLAGFSVACLFLVLTLDSSMFSVLLASCLLTASTACFSIIVLSKYHILHKTKDMHIGHVIVSEDSAEKPQKIGAICLAFGFLCILFSFSFITFLVGLVAFILASKQHNKFVSDSNGMVGFREFMANKKST
ncbi:MAG: hypothetical protein ACPHLK_00965 [Gammaproteobacteria bacterium]|jgi:uncharacterized membrane protein